MSVFQISSFPPRTLQTETCPTPHARRHPGDVPDHARDRALSAPDCPASRTLPARALSGPDRPRQRRRRLYLHFGLSFKFL
jgi:hypothetical protein